MRNRKGHPGAHGPVGLGMGSLFSQSGLQIFVCIVSPMLPSRSLRTRKLTGRVVERIFARMLAQQFVDGVR